MDLTAPPLSVVVTAELTAARSRQIARSSISLIWTRSVKERILGQHWWLKTFQTSMPVFLFGVFLCALYILLAGCPHSVFPEFDRYTSKMLLAAIDELHKGTYDFFYLPIDFKVVYLILLYAVIFQWGIRISSSVIIVFSFSPAEQMQCWLCVHQHDIPCAHCIFLPGVFSLLALYMFHCSLIDPCLAEFHSSLCSLVELISTAWNMTFWMPTFNYRLSMGRSGRNLTARR